MASKDAKSGKIIVFFLVIGLMGFGAYQLFVTATHALEKAKNDATTRIERVLRQST